MGDSVVGAHHDLHSDQGARQGDHPGRSRDPNIKVHDIAWSVSRSRIWFALKRFRGRSALAPQLDWTNGVIACTSKQFTR